MNHAAEHPQVPPKRLWFGFSGGAVAWIVLGIADLLITWQARQGGNEGWGALSKGGVVALYVVITALLLLTTLASGMTAYRNWRATSSASTLAEAEAVGREEFMALAGLFVAVSFVVGIIWLGLPFIVIDICARAR